MSAYLNEAGIKNRWMDAQNFISTDNTYREGKINWSLTEKLVKMRIPQLIKKNKIIITQGFIASTSENFTTTLGREGSDYTAAILSYCLDAEEMVVWKDVPGILSADPKYAVEGYTKEGQHLRIIFAVPTGRRGAGNSLVVVTCMELNVEWQCDCK